jgi:hypothetical protein
MIHDLEPPLRAARRHPRHLGRSLLVAGTAALLVRVTLGGASGTLSATGAETVVVAAGDSLWSIAAAHFPGDDPRERVGQIEQLNGLPSADIHPGDRLLLPGP